MEQLVSGEEKQRWEGHERPLPIKRKKGRMRDEEARSTDFQDGSTPIQGELEEALKIFTQQLTIAQNNGEKKFILMRINCMF